MAETKSEFEPWKLINRLRLTEDEQRELMYYLFERVDAKPATEVGIVAFDELFTEAKEIADNGDKMIGLSTGYKNTIDRMTMGLVGGDLTVIYGYTSMGKSQLAQNIALNVARAHTPVLFVGLELTNKQNAARMIKMGGTDAGLPMLFPNKADISYQEIQQAIKKAKAMGAGLVVVDQLQDLIHSVTNEQAEIGQVMAELKRAAIDSDLPVILVSHVNRQGAQPGAPSLEMLKGSSSIEQKADICIAVYQDHEAEEGDKLYGKMLVALRKNRHRGMAFRTAELVVERNMRLREENAIEAIFPGAQTLEGLAL